MNQTSNIEPIDMVYCPFEFPVQWSWHVEIWLKSKTFTVHINCVKYVFYKLDVNDAFIIQAPETPIETKHSYTWHKNINVIETIKKTTNIFFLNFCTKFRLVLMNRGVNLRDEIKKWNQSNINVDIVFFFWFLKILKLKLKCNL